MTTAQILLIAVALAADAFAVALAAGLGLKRVGGRRTLRLAWHFGLFQSLMNIAGWAAGLGFRTLIASFDHWLAFGLLSIIGARMIGQALGGGDESPIDPTRGRRLVILSIATSIDAMAVGLSFSVLAMSIWMPALVIGITAFCLTAAGIHLGRLLGKAARLGTWAEITGGLILLAIGFNILWEHGVF